MTASYGSARFDIGTEVLGSVAVVAVVGELDMSTTPEFSTEVENALSASPTGVIVDLTEVQFLSSSAITVLLSAHENESSTIPIIVVADNPATRRPLELVGLTSVLTVVQTRAAALESLTPA